MNNERMPINLYTIDFGEGNKELTEEEFKKQKREDCKPWELLIGVCVIFYFIFISINVRSPEATTVWGWIFLYLLLTSLSVLSFFKIKKIMKAKYIKSI